MTLTLNSVCRQECGVKIFDRLYAKKYFLYLCDRFCWTGWGARSASRTTGSTELRPEVTSTSKRTPRSQREFTPLFASMCCLATSSIRSDTLFGTDNQTVYPTTHIFVQNCSR